MSFQIDIWFPNIYLFSIESKIFWDWKLSTSSYFSNKTSSTPEQRTACFLLRFSRLQLRHSWWNATHPSLHWIRFLWISPSSSDIQKRIEVTSPFHNTLVNLPAKQHLGGVIAFTPSGKLRNSIPLSSGNNCQIIQFDDLIIGFGYFAPSEQFLDIELFFESIEKESNTWQKDVIIVAD